MTPTITGPDQHGRLTVHADAYNILVAPRTSYEAEHPYVMVADAVAHATDPHLAALSAEEAALGELRSCERVEYGGAHPEVDALYDRLNAKVAEVKTAVARDALRALAGVVDGDVERAADAAFFSKHAGCRICACSPGVTMGVWLRLDGNQIDVWVEPA